MAGKQDITVKMLAEQIRPAIEKVWSEVTSAANPIRDELQKIDAQIAALASGKANAGIKSSLSRVRRELESAANASEAQLRDRFARAVTSACKQIGISIVEKSSPTTSKSNTGKPAAGSQPRRKRMTSQQKQEYIKSIQKLARSSQKNGISRGQVMEKLDLEGQVVTGLLRGMVDGGMLVRKGERISARYFLKKKS